MTTPEQPEQRPLTRKEMRQIRDTAATPIIPPGDHAVEADPPAESAPPAPVPAAPLPRPADLVDVPPAPVPDASVDLGVSPLTRRQARQQERIRTASVPVITPDMAAAHAEAARAEAAAHADGSESEPSSGSDASVAPEPSAGSDASAGAEAHEDAAAPAPVSAVPARSGPTAVQASSADTASGHAGDSPEQESDEPERVTLDPAFGSELLSGGAAPAVSQPSFDQLLSRGTAATGSVSTPNALILTQTPEGALMGPVAATGEVLITGTFALPEGLGSQGHAAGTTDGREVDAVLVDGELPAHSSPTPIAASAAVSTIKTTGDIIQPPAPEKGSRLMLALAITAGVLAIAVVGVLIVAVVTGAFS